MPKITHVTVGYGRTVEIDNIQNVCSGRGGCFVRLKTGKEVWANCSKWDLLKFLRKVRPDKYLR
jgi:hypothetical protein